MTCCVVSDPLRWYRDQQPQLYTVLPEKKVDRVGASVMGSTHVYDIPTVSGWVLALYLGRSEIRDVPSVWWNSRWNCGVLDWCLKEVCRWCCCCAGSHGFGTRSRWKNAPGTIRTAVEGGQKPYCQRRFQRYGCRTCCSSGMLPAKAVVAQYAGNLLDSFGRRQNERSIRRKKQERRVPRRNIKSSSSEDIFFCSDRWTNCMPASSVRTVMYQCYSERRMFRVVVDLIHRQRNFIILYLLTMFLNVLPNEQLCTKNPPYCFTGIYICAETFVRSAVSQLEIRWKISLPIFKVDSRIFISEGLWLDIAQSKGALHLKTGNGAIFYVFWWKSFTN